VHRLREQVEGEARRRPSMAHGGARCARARGRRQPLYPCVRRWGLSYASRRGSRGMGTRRCGHDNQWWLAGGAAGQWSKASQPPGTCGCGAWHRPTGPPVSRTGTQGRRMDHWALQSLGVWAQQSRGAATCDASARSGAPGCQPHFSLALFRRVLLKFLKQKWSKCSIAKL
jgi:hypothetical protein